MLRRLAPSRSFINGLAFCAISLALAAGIWAGSQAMSAPAAFKSEDPPFRGLDANLYLQTSAEYRGCCYQAYNLAKYRLKEAKDNNRNSRRPLAVIMDLDEVVMDNAGYWTMLLRSNLANDLRLWEYWEEKCGGMVGLVPGAKDFIQTAERWSVAVFYISNRSEKFRPQNKQILQNLGIPVVDDNRLKLRTGISSDKTGRRREVEKDYLVVLLVGDNLRDFDEDFRCPDLDPKTPAELSAAIQQRKDAVDRQWEVWGDKYIVLPNPVYGEWIKPLGPGKSVLDRLAPQAPSLFPE